MSPCALAYLPKSPEESKFNNSGWTAKSISLHVPSPSQSTFHGGIIIVSGPIKRVYPPTVPKLSRMVELASG